MAAVKFSGLAAAGALAAADLLAISQAAGGPTSKSVTGQNIATFISSNRNCFSANKNGTDQSGIANDTFTKITFGTTSFQQGTTYNTATSVWTPTAGPILLSVILEIVTGFTVGGLGLATIYKNGSRFKDLSDIKPDGTGTIGISGTILDLASGTDTYEIYVYIDTATSINIGGATYATHVHGTCL
jgi:hypothetical protein